MAAPISETELVRRAQGGDRAAFQGLYETYLPKIHDFVLGMLRNRADAEDATSETFLRAVESLADLRDPAAFKGWLYTIARNAALRIISGRAKATPVAEHFEADTTVATLAVQQPEEGAEQAELRALFDDAASTLSERDRTVFELTVRHEFGSAEVARVLKVRPAYAYILVNRLKGSVNEALETVLLARVGGTECPELAETVQRFGGEVSPRMRKAVARHARACTVCAETKRRRASIPALLAGVAWAAPSAAFAAELAARIDAQWNAHPPSGPGGGGNALSHLAGAAAAIVVLSGALVGLGAQRTLVTSEQGPAEPVKEVLPAPEREAESEAQPEAPPAPRQRRTVERAPSTSGSSDAGVSVVGGVSGGSSDGGGASTTNSSEVNVGNETGHHSSPDDGDCCASEGSQSPNEQPPQDQGPNQGPGPK